LIFIICVVIVVVVIVVVVVVVVVVDYNNSNFKKVFVKFRKQDNNKNKIQIYRVKHT